MTGTADRPRDTSGRPRNDRPRDGLGRPLPRGAAGVDRQPEGVLRTPAETLAQARQLLAAGRPFHAHEVFEDAWKSSTSATDRRLWHGLAQLAVGLTHAARENRAGAVSLLRRAADTLEPLAGRIQDVDVAAVRTWAAQAADTLSTEPAAVIALPPLGGDPDRP